MSNPRILAIPGSLRVASLNRKLLAIGVAAARKGGADVDVVDLKTLALPVYDGDIEAAGMPPAALDLKDRIAAARGLLIATPEYNWGIPGGLKNAIDWASRGGSNPFRDKYAALMSASPGPMGGLRSVVALRRTLSALGVYLLPRDYHLARASDDAFLSDGSLADPKQHEQIESLVTTFLGQLK